MNRKTCEGCIYCRRISSTDSTSPKVCHYLLDTKKIRTCPAGGCIVKKNEKAAPLEERAIKSMLCRKTEEKGMVTFGPKAKTLGVL